MKITRRKFVSICAALAFAAIGSGQSVDYIKKEIESGKYYKNRAGELERELNITKSELKNKEEILLATEQELKETEAYLDYLKTELHKYDGKLILEKNPTYDEVLKFIVEDKTDSKSYKPREYECTNFALDVCNNAMNKGLFCSPVVIRFRHFGHVIVAFNTSDKGMIYYDPQSDLEVTLKTGKYYFRENDLPFSYNIDDRVLYKIFRYLII
jgi:hypothetical protein